MISLAAYRAGIKPHDTHEAGIGFSVNSIDTVAHVVAAVEAAARGATIFHGIKL